MNWLVVVPVGWTVVALVVGLIVGRGIRMAGGSRPECPLPCENAAVHLPAVAAVDEDDVPDQGDDVPDHGRALERSLAPTG
jgi:hypothetical protein